MSEIIATANLSGFTSTITATGTVTPIAIINAVKKSELSLTEQTILIATVTHITNKGISDTEKLLSLAYKALTETPELFNKLIEIINQSC